LVETKRSRTDRCLRSSYHQLLVVAIRCLQFLFAVSSVLLVSRVILLRICATWHLGALGRVKRRSSEQVEPEERILEIAPVSIKGQLVIPLLVRRIFGIDTGDRIEFVQRGQELLLRKQRISLKPPA